MARRGYSEEYKVKKELIQQYGVQNVVKIAIGGAFDYLAIEDGKIAEFVEVKGCHQKKWYPKDREKDQIRRMKELASHHSALARVWIVRPNQPIEKRSVFDFNFE